MNIHTFKKGDEIVRVSPAKPYSPVTFGPFGSQGGHQDRSYLGEKLIFIGIANGQIYLQRTNKAELEFFGDKMLDLSLDVWDEGWELYIDPKKLLEGFEVPMDNKTLEEQIQKAVEAENYELAETLRKRLPKK